MGKFGVNSGLLSMSCMSITLSVINFDGDKIIILNLDDAFTIEEVIESTKNSTRTQNSKSSPNYQRRKLVSNRGESDDSHSTAPPTTTSTTTTSTTTTTTTTTSTTTSTTTTTTSTTTTSTTTGT